LTHLFPSVVKPRKTGWRRHTQTKPSLNHVDPLSMATLVWLNGVTMYIWVLLTETGHVTSHTNLCLWKPRKSSPHLKPRMWCHLQSNFCRGHGSLVTMKIPVVKSLTDWALPYLGNQINIETRAPLSQLLSGTCGAAEGSWIVWDAKEATVMQQREFSSQQFSGETKRRVADFRKRVLTVRPSLAVPQVLAYRSVAVEAFCQQMSQYMQSVCVRWGQ